MYHLESVFTDIFSSVLHSWIYFLICSSKFIGINSTTYRNKFNKTRRRLPPTGGWNRYTFLYSSCQVYPQTLDMMGTTNLRKLGKLERRRKSSEWPMEWWGGDFPGFSFCCMYLIFETDEAKTQKCQLVQREKCPQTNQFSLTKGPEKGKPNMRENF